MTGGAMRACDPDSAVMKAWEAYQKSEDFANTLRWVTVEQRMDRSGPVPPGANRVGAEHLDRAAVGSLWAAFMAGFLAASERAAMLHESVNPASSEERLAKVPGAGGMGAVIEYRDLIRANLT
jgi:hypothetical protein